MSSFDDIIQGKAASHEAPVPPGAWNKIMPPKKKRRYLFWYWMLAALLVAGVGIPAILHLQYDQSTTASNQAGGAPGVSAGAKNKAVPVQAAEEANENNSIAKAEKEAPANKHAEENHTDSKVASIEHRNNNSVGVELSQSVPKKQLQGKAVLRTRSAEADESFADVMRTEANVNRSKVAGKKLTQTSDAKASVKVNGGLAGEDENDAADQTAGTTAQTKQQETMDINGTVTTPAVIEAPGNKAALMIDPASSAKKAAVTGVEGATAESPKKPVVGGLFAELSVTPFFPLQQGDGSINFSRTITSNGVRKEFTANQFSRQLSTAIGLQVALRKSLGSKWQIGTGVQYAVLKELVQLKGTETTTGYTIVNQLRQVNNVPVLVVDSVETITKGSLQIDAVNSYRFISVPLFVQYQAGKVGAFDLAFTGGLYFNVQSNYSNSVNALINRSAAEPAGGMGVDVFGGLRLSKLFAHRFNLFAEPTMRLNIASPNVKNALVNAPVRRVFVAVGAAFKLK